MARSKYQLDVDGFAASYDGKFWKLKSGSAVFSVSPQDADGTLLQLHEQFYSPLLHDKVNYFRTSAQDLPKLMEWCKQYEGTCMQVGAAGRQLTLCDVTPQSTLQYTYLTLKRIHDMYNVTLNSKGQTAYER